MEPAPLIRRRPRRRGRALGLAAGAATGVLGFARVVAASGQEPPPASAAQCRAGAADCAAEAGQGLLQRSWRLADGGLELELVARSTSGESSDEAASSLAWGSIRWVGLADDPYANSRQRSEREGCEELLLGPLFEVGLRHKRRVVSSSSCRLAAEPTATATSLAAELHCPRGLKVLWRVSLAPVRLPAPAALASQEPASEEPVEEVVAGAAARMEIDLLGPEKAAPQNLTMLALPSGSPCGSTPLVEETGTVDGSPALAQGRFFLASEHPLGKQDMNATTLTPGRLLESRVEHLFNRSWCPRTGRESSRPSSGACAKPFRYGAVLGAFAEPLQARRVFQAYLDAARPQTSWQGPLTHYNSWYDFTSWQDEGFFGPRQARNPQQAYALRSLLRELQKDQMHEQTAIKVVETFGEELVQKRGVVLNSFLWDDGWDDPEEGMWAFDRDRFPKGFTRLADTARKHGCGNGVWLSPWGGYGQGKERRLQAAKEQGLETNAHGLSLAGPRYFQRFKEAALFFRREAGVNFFKFDGVAGDATELAAEMEAMLGIAAEMHTTGDGELWINLTTGTWPSPFFLLWVDSIWRGHTDTQVVPQESLPGATVRQRWHAFRECIVHELVVKRARFFPLARLMVHGVVLAQHGDARAHGLHQASELDWMQEVWSFVSMGLLLQELYVSAELMDPWRWDVTAEALAWGRRHAKLLEDSHWFLPATCLGQGFQPHGWAAWRGGMGFLTLRHLHGERKVHTRHFTLAEALELPLAATSSPGGVPRSLAVKVERRFSLGDYSWEQEAGSCAFLVGSEPLGDGTCRLPATHNTQVRMDAGDLLILRVWLL